MFRTRNRQPKLRVASMQLANGIQQQLQPLERGKTAEHQHLRLVRRGQKLGRVKDAMWNMHHANVSLARSKPGGMAPQRDTYHIGNGR